MKKRDWEAVYKCVNPACTTGSVWVTFKNYTQEEVPTERIHAYCGTVMKRVKMTAKGCEGGKWWVDE